MLHVSEFGKNPVTFMEAAYVTDTHSDEQEVKNRTTQTTVDPTGRAGFEPRGRSPAAADSGSGLLQWTQRARPE